MTYRKRAIEAKVAELTASPGGRDLAALSAFLDLYDSAAPLGILISMHPRLERLTPRIYNVPLGMVLHGV